MGQFRCTTTTFIVYGSILVVHLLDKWSAMTFKNLNQRSLKIHLKCLLQKSFFILFFFSGKEKCDDLHSFEPSSVFAIHYDNWEWFFLAEKKSAVMDGIHSSFATHLWAHFFKQHIQWDGIRQDQAFFHIAKRNCPKVFYGV